MHKLKEEEEKCSKIAIYDVCREKVPKTGRFEQVWQKRGDLVPSRGDGEKWAKTGRSPRHTGRVGRSVFAYILDFAVSKPAPKKISLEKDVIAMRAALWKMKWIVWKFVIHKSMAETLHLESLDYSVNILNIQWLFCNQFVITLTNFPTNHSVWWLSWGVNDFIDNYEVLLVISDYSAIATDYL